MRVCMRVHVYTPLLHSYTCVCVCLRVYVCVTTTRVQPVYVHIAAEDIQWYTTNESGVFQELATALCDHITLIQQLYQQQVNGTTRGSSVVVEELHHLHGKSIQVSYAVRKSVRQYDNTLLYRTHDGDDGDESTTTVVPELMSTSSFSLNPLYIKPL